VFQPQVDAEGQLVGAEVLTRWTHQGNPISPDRFIRAAEETNQIVALGQWILGASVDALRRWREKGRLPPSFRRLAINISVKQFMEPRFEAMLAEAMAAAAIPNGAIELELTESVFVENKEQVREKMQRLSECGFSFAMDDFGTGYSSLSYLQHLPIDKLKIDRSFVMDIQRDDGSARIVDSIIQLGRSLGVAVIAEGVETEVQKRYLEARGCLRYQGYFFSRPLGEDAFLAFAQTARTEKPDDAALSRPNSAGTPLPP
jgi:EAL domain-containing protein (putative c-di-GMP-specific phosphodiesterase class I)